MLHIRRARLLVLLGLLLLRVNAYRRRLVSNMHDVPSRHGGGERHPALQLERREGEVAPVRIEIIRVDLHLCITAGAWCGCGQ